MLVFKEDGLTIIALIINMKKPVRIEVHSYPKTKIRCLQKASRCFNWRTLARIGSTQRQGVSSERSAKTGGVFGEKCKDRWCLEDTTCLKVFEDTPCLKVFEDTPCLKVLSTRLHRKHPGAVRGEFSGETVEAFKHAFQFDGCT